MTQIAHELLIHLRFVVLCVKGGEEKVKIERPGGAPVWTLSWNPSK